MAQLWIDPNSNALSAFESDGAWIVASLGASAVALPHGPVLPESAALPLPASPDNLPAGAVLLPCPTPIGCDWVLLAPRGDCLVNGEPLLLGIRFLRDRDEIQPFPGTRWYFSTESRAVIAPFVARDTATICPRCLEPIEPGTPTVICPGCAIAYHEADNLKRLCWSHAPCATCGHPTDAQADFSWTPEDL